MIPKMEEIPESSLRPGGLGAGGWQTDHVEDLGKVSAVIMMAVVYTGVGATVDLVVAGPAPNPEVRNRFLRTDCRRPYLLPPNLCD